MKEGMTTYAAAKTIGRTTRTLRRAINARQLKAVRIDGRYRIAPEDLAVYVASRQKRGAK
jgi:excisionase family DNA binding protein